MEENSIYMLMYHHVCMSCINIYYVCMYTLALPLYDMTHTMLHITHINTHEASHDT